MHVLDESFELRTSARACARRLGLVLCGSALLVLGAAGAASAATPGQLLVRYTPTLKYNQPFGLSGTPGDGYRADSAAEITNNYRATGAPFDCSGSGDGYSNALKRQRVARPGGHPPPPTRVLAAADPRANCPRLSLRFLGATYPDGSAALGDDFLDEHNGTEAADAARMHNNPGLRNHIYGRAIRSGGRLWLQYWFFYYYNPQNEFGLGVHEGDWEMIELGLNDNGRPFRGVYAQHDGHEVCRWSLMEKQGTSPLVFVADGSHASYFTSGVQSRTGLPDDSHYGDGPAASPNNPDPAAHLTLEDISSPGPSWLRWPGMWGASRSDGTGQSDSPRGPKFHDAWTHPKGIAQSTTSGGHSCLVAT